MREILLISLLIGALALRGQRMEEVERLPFEKVSFFNTNHLGQIYVVYENEIQLFDPNGSKIASYSDPLSGDIRFIDTFNPMRVLLFFDAFFNLQFLDNRLNPIQDEVRLEEHGFFDAQLASSVDQDQIWFYDQSLDRLIKWSVGDTEEIARTLTISQLVNEEASPSRLLSRMDRVFLLLPGKGVIIFDQFGGFIKYVKLPKIGASLQIKNDLLIFNEGSQLIKLNYKTLQEWRIELPPETKQFRLEGNLLYCLQNSNIVIYKILTP